MKTDQENAITELQNEIARQRGIGNTTPDNSRVGDSTSNGTAEQAVQEVEGMVRTIRAAFEEKLQKEIIIAYFRHLRMK